MLREFCLIPFTYYFHQQIPTPSRFSLENTASWRPTPPLNLSRNTRMPTLYINTSRDTLKSITILSNSIPRRLPLMDIFDTQHSRLAILSQTTQIGNYRPPLPLDHFHDVIKHCEPYHSIESCRYIPNRMLQHIQGILPSSFNPYHYY